MASWNTDSSRTAEQQRSNEMAVNGFLTRLFKSDEKKKKNHSSPAAAAAAPPQTSVQHGTSPAVIVSPHSATSLASSAGSVHRNGEERTDLRPAPMNLASSSSSVLRPVDSHNHLPHLKLARFLEKRHLKHHEFNEIHDRLREQRKVQTAPKVPHVQLKPKESKFDDYDALVQLVSKYGIIPADSVDLMKLLQYTDNQTEIQNRIQAMVGSEEADGDESGQENTANAESEAMEPIKVPEVPESKDVSTALIIGKGAGGSVYPLYDRKHNHLYAMKKLRLQLSREDWSTYETKLKNEFKIANKLHHQNLIRTYDLLQDNDLFIIVMDYAPYDFFTIVMSGVLTKHEIYCYFKQMCIGVHYMHSIGLAHRDLKLDNCVVDKNGILKIVDFGSSVVFDYGLYQQKGKSESIEKAQGILGSDPYLSPEVVAVPFYDPSLADVWSLAIIYCCMILRRFPWKIPKDSDISYSYFISKPGEITDKNGNKKVVGPDRLLRLLPTSSKHVIDHMLKVDPSQRYSMDQVMESHFITKIKNCHYENYDSNRNQGVLVKGDDHTHHLITNKEFTESHPDEVKQEKEREEKQAKEILAANNA